MKYLDHVGIAVADLEEAINTYEKLLNISCYKRETVEQQKVETAFFKAGVSKVELLGSTAPDSVIDKFISRQGEGMHHIAFEVDDIQAEMRRLEEEGFTLLSEEPRPGADDKLVAFVHPKDNCGVLIELCQSAGK